MNINNFIMPILILLTFVISLIWRKFLILCIPFILCCFAVWIGYFGEYPSIYFVIPSMIGFITLLLLIAKAVKGELL